MRVSQEQGERPLSTDSEKKPKAVGGTRTLKKKAPNNPAATLSTR